MAQPPDHALPVAPAAPRPEPRLAAAVPWLARLPTGAKLFLILSIGLLPLALIAMAATVQTTRLNDDETRARLRVTSIEVARSVAIELAGDMTALSTAAAALGIDAADAPSCARASGVFAQQSAAGARFAITDDSGKVICGESLPFAARREQAGDAAISGDIVPGRGLLLSLRATRTGAESEPGTGTRARAFFPLATLAQLGRPTSRAMPFAAELELDGDALPLATMGDIAALDRLETMRTEVGVAGLSLRTETRSAPLSSSFLVALLLPLFMWIAGAGVSWLVVDRLLIRPLRRLRTSVAAFTPGEVIDTGAAGPLPATELRELGDTFRAITRTVAIHEAGLAEGLVRQTKLTREVHHRVKNNLQVISSLINFHARGAPSADASDAYASIQRRVDALAVVHRNHFAENEDNRGLNLRTMIGELTANIRATAPDHATLGITLEVEPVMANQDVAVAIAFLVTETVELAMNCDPAAQIRLVLREAGTPGRAVLRVVSRALIESDLLRELLRTRYGRVMEGLSRQLRSPLHHDPLAGAYEIEIAATGRA